ncbi:MAG: ferrous iron transport protein B [Flavobacteriales bacterium AspAUS03]
MEIVKLAIVGNPNVGKTTLFNKLTGLHQKIGNYPGVTIDKKSGFFKYADTQFQILDLPGAYSLYPSSKDEEVVFRVLNKYQNADHPDKVIVLADGTNLRRSLLLFQQVQDLGLPVLLVLNMVDEAQRRGITIDTNRLSQEVSTAVVSVNARKGVGLDQVKKQIKILHSVKLPDFDPGFLYKDSVEAVKIYHGMDNIYQAWHYLACGPGLSFGDEDHLQQLIRQHKIVPRRLQVKETFERYKKIEGILSRVVFEYPKSYSRFSEKIDRYVTHPFWGYWIFFLLLFLIFQGVYFWAEGPKDFIEDFFFDLQRWMHSILPVGPLNGLLSQGIIPGLGTILAFVPQIIILFFFLFLMEESGYISRVVFLMDRVMRPFGLNGKSIVPLISGTACAIPAVMSARNIENPRDRLITILVTPLMTCSARLPVYTLIIALVIPDDRWGIFQLRGLILMGMYLLGVIAVLGAAMLFHQILKRSYKNYLIMEIPSYKWPVLSNIGISLWMGLKAFILGAGKIILAVSVILWVLGSFGPSGDIIHSADETVSTFPELGKELVSTRLDQSYLEIIGKKIEPVIRPLGYDWKIGIGLLSSLAAREVFVSTMASVYSLGDVEVSLTLRQKMQQEIRAETGRPVYDLATGVSLLIFYAFSMQCMSTLAVVKKETKSWKWPIIQLIFMTGLAYFVSFIVYQILK